MKCPSLLALPALILILSVSSLYAAPPKDWTQPTWKVTKEQFNVIKEIDTTSGTVSISHVGGNVKLDRTLKTSSFTEIMVDGKKSTLASLKAGMHVDYTLGGDGDTIARIATVAEQPAAPTPVPTATPSFPNFDKK